MERMKMKDLDKFLERFDGARIKATAFNIKCAEDNDSIREHLINKYGVENVEESQQCFTITNKDRRYPKPWLPRSRIGIFHRRGRDYFIENLEYSAKGRGTPRRSIFPVSSLRIKDSRTLVAIIDASRNFYIEYTLLDEKE